MIINVSGRTDIVNYYSKWLVKRLEEGFAYTRNPYNHNQVTCYDLSPDKIDAIIFCSKNYQPILEDMPMIEKKYPIFCYYTITAYEEDVERNVPSIDESISTLKSLSKIVGRKKLSWRYDPILLTEKYDIDAHLEKFEYISSKIHRDISFCVFSFVDMYRKVYRNMPEIIELTDNDKKEILEGISKIAHKYDITLQSCATITDYSNYDIRKSGCITTDILEKSNNLKFKNVKANGSREGCMCLPWRDIGEYDTCLNACKYCYANKRPNIAKKKYERHKVTSPILIGHIKEEDKITASKQKSLLLRDNKQTTLF